MRPILLVISDLLFRSRIDDAARHANVPLRVAKSMEQLERHLAKEAPSLAIVDLEADTIDAAAAIRRLRATPGGDAVRIVAYAGHTNLGAIKAGRDAGAGVVLARSGFIAQLSGLLSRAADDAGAAEAAGN
jgi:DNA-binding response OmpR family regulator